MFNKILIANRGEIAVRVIKTCKRSGHSHRGGLFRSRRGHAGGGDGGRGGVHRPAGAGRILSADGQDHRRPAWRPARTRSIPASASCLRTRAFPKALAEKGIAWIGPNPHAIAAMGDKLESKKLAAEAGVSTVPGFKGEIEDDQQAVEVAERDRLSGDDQGVRRRRRQGHAHRAL
jgi:propionyl-CoA carboxylase alpha chain